MIMYRPNNIMELSNVGQVTDSNIPIIICDSTVEYGVRWTWILLLVKSINIMLKSNFCFSHDSRDPISLSGRWLILDELW